jgi:hypothetical protein
VPVGVKTRGRRHDVVVVDQQHSVVGVARVVVVAERKRVPGVQPRRLGDRPVGGSPYLDGGGHGFKASLTANVLAVQHVLIILVDVVEPVRAVSCEVRLPRVVAASGHA